MDDDKSSNMDQIRMGSLTGVFAAIVAPARGSGASADLQQLPRTRQDVVVEETTIRAEAPVSNPRVASINMLAIDHLGLPLSRGTLHGNTLDEPHEAQQNVGNSRGRRADSAVDKTNEKVKYPLKWPIAPQHSRRWEKPETTIIRRGTIHAGPLHFTNPVPTLPDGWVEHTHLEGKLYYVRDKSSAVQGAPFTLTIVTDSDPRNPRNLRGLNNVHRQVVEAIKDQDMRLPKNVRLFIEIYPKQDDWSHVGGYYLADLDNQSIFWVEDVDSQDLGLGDKINFGVFGEQHLKLLLHQQFWLHIECYPLPGSIDEKQEHETLLKHLTFAMLDVSTSSTSTSTYTASECSEFIGSIEKTPENSRTWSIARISGAMAEHRFYNYYGHPSARLNHLHAFEVERTEEDAPAPAAPTEQMPEQSTWRRRVHDLRLRTTTFWYRVVAFWLRLCSFFLFDAPIRYHTTLEDLFVNKNVFKRSYKQAIAALLDDWTHASFLSTVLLAANMAFLAIPAPQEIAYPTAQLYPLQTAAYTCSLFSTVFSIGSITLGLINTRRHPRESTYNEIADLLQGARHHHYGFRPLATVYALPIASLMWAVVGFAGAIALYCLMETSITPRAAVLASGAFLIGCTLVTVWYFWQRETRWGYGVEGVAPKRQQRIQPRVADWFWDLSHYSNR